MSLLLRSQEGQWKEVYRRAQEAGELEDPWHYSLLAEALVGSGDAERAWEAAQRTVALEPSVATNLAVYFAYLGQMQRAAELAKYLPADSPRIKVYEAMARWKQGDLPGAIEELRAVADQEALSFDPAISHPLYLLGEALSEAGRDEEAVAALRRFQSMPLTYPSWMYPRSLYYLARSLERMGDREGARESIKTLMRLWKNADPEQPLLAEARSLARRIGRE
jgi:tetratricopeptide (TPR) repeat protein